MIIDLNATPEKTESTNIPSEKLFLDGYYNTLKETVDYESFLKDIQTSIEPDREKILGYLSTNLLNIQEDPYSPERTPISYVDTNDNNVELMQKKINDLGASEIPLRDQNFLAERSYTISTFRGLQMIVPIIGSQFPESYGYLISFLKKQLGSQIAVGEENSFREKVFNSNEVLLYPSRDADLRKSKEYINPNGKVTEMEMGAVVLPRIIKVLRNISQKTPAFTI